MGSKLLTTVIFAALAILPALSQDTGTPPKNEQPKKSGTESAAPVEYVRSVVGFEQVGASSADSQQKYFLDLFVSRKLAGRVLYWGDVRISSIAQQITDKSVLEFSGAFAESAGALKVNELAQSGEFLAGLEFKLSNHIGLIAGGGGTGILQPDKSLKLFKVPGADSPQKARFDATFKLPSGSTYIGFPAADRDRYFRNWLAGTRLTFLESEKGAPPFTVDLTIGQNEAITGGRLRGSVFRADTFFPLALSKGDDPPVVYFFGTVLFGLSRAKQTDPFILEPAEATVTPYEPKLGLVTQQPNNRDIYRIGVGIDLVRLAGKLLNSNQQNKQVPPVPAPVGGGAPAFNLRVR